jgi:hypothetical protein
MTMETAVAGAPDGYPLRFDVEYPERLSRLLNNIPYLKMILVIPHLIALLVMSILAGVINFFAWWAILFTGKYPRGLFDFYVNVLRWGLNVNVYETMMRDEYPAFSGEDGRYRAVTYTVDYPERLSRLLNNIPYLKVILLIPHFIVLIFLAIGWLVVNFIAWWAILFTGTYPRGLFDYSVGVFRWSARVTAYAAMLTDDYPPFSLR